MPRKVFNDEDDETLIEAVKSYPLLYDNEHKDYRNNQMKDEAWKEVSKLLGKNGDACKKRWKDIRDNFYRIFRRARKDTGTTPEKLYSRWHLFDSLLFLKPIQKERLTINHAQTDILPDFDAGAKVEEVSTSETSIDNIEIGSFCEAQIQDSRMTDNSCQCSSPEAKRRKLEWTELDMSSLEENSKRRMDLLEALVNKRAMDETEDDVDVFMKSVAMTVKKLPTHLVPKAKLNILAAVTELQLGLEANQSVDPASNTELLYPL